MSDPVEPLLITREQINRLRQVIADVPVPACGEDCEHIECSYVVACERYSASITNLTRTVLVPVLDELERALSQEQQTALVLEGMVADFQAVHDAQVPLELKCPKCDMIHVDQDEWATTRLHRTHLCHGCGNLWRPYPVTTVGVDVHAKCREVIANFKEMHKAYREAARLTDKMEGLAKEQIASLKEENAARKAAAQHADNAIGALTDKSAHLENAVASGDKIIANQEKIIEIQDQIIEKQNRGWQNLEVENAKLVERRDELLKLVAKVSSETPYPADLDECKSARRALMAEVGTLRARVVELESMLPAQASTK